MPHCDTRKTLRQISWLETQLRQAGPQALTVRVSTARQLGAFDPDTPALGALADLVPGSAFRGVLPLAPVAVVGLVAFLALVLIPPRSSAG